MNDELHHAWRRFRDDPDAFVLVITGAGDAFCAGWDLQDAADWPRPDWDEFRTHLYDSAGDCGYTRRADVFKPVIAAVNGWAVAAGLENALLADIRIVAEQRRLRRARAALEHRRRRRDDGAAAAGRRLGEGDGADHHRAAGRRRGGAAIGLANEVVAEGEALERALELAREIAALPQGAIRTDKETMIRNVGRTFEERLRQEVEAALSMFLRRDSHAIGAGAFKRERDARVAAPRALSGDAPQRPHAGSRGPLGLLSRRRWPRPGTGRGRRSPPG